MPRDRVEYIRELGEAFQRRDYAPTVEALDPDVVLDATHFSEIVPDLADVYHGRDGVRAFWRSWLSSWSDLKWDIGDVREAGDAVVMVVENQRQFGRQSGIRTEVPAYAWLYRFSGDKIVRVEMHPTPEEGFRAAGISE